MNILNSEFDNALLQQRIIFIQGLINGDLQERVIKSLEYLNAVNPKEEIILKIDTTGGGLVAGKIICENIRNSPSPVNGIVIGAAYSSGFTILQSCHTRTAYGHSALLFHPPSIKDANVWAYNLDSVIKELREEMHYFLEHLSRRSGQSFEVLAQYAVKNKCFTGYEGKELGLVDVLL